MHTGCCSTFLKWDSKCEKKEKGRHRERDPYARARGNTHVCKHTHTLTNTTQHTHKHTHTDTPMFVPLRTRCWWRLVQWRHQLFLRLACLWVFPPPKMEVISPLSVEKKRYLLHPDLITGAILGLAWLAQTFPTPLPIYFPVCRASLTKLFPGHSVH